MTRFALLLALSLLAGGCTQADEDAATTALATGESSR